MELDLTSIHKLAAEQGIDAQTLDAALSEALRLAYLKTPHAAKHARVELDDRAGTFTVWAADETPGTPTEDDPHPAPIIGEEYDDTPKDFGRLAASTARQVLSQLFRHAEDERVFGAFSGQKGKLITGIVQQDVKDPSNVHIAVGDVEALLPRREQVPGERYRHGERLRVFVVNVGRGVRGPEIVVSRSHPDLVRRLFEREVPELASGAVSIMAIAREAGARTKIAVKANTDGVNPKGALIGPGGARVRAVMENLGPEKIDIVDYSDDPAKFVASALSPAVATGVQVISEKNKTAIAFIHDDQLSLAIGREGQNARLAAKLTGWKIGIESAEAHARKLAAEKQAD
ncbi:transcription termination/antitermination protein NusA [Bifidobacterium rousetti]|uniref:transcription termination factor NusA n=1 Tax=Bifidobacterium rousetti TaxID=2045439 RepID=UPI00123874B2|nr:transcription termination factor NusA [Bifidobacterium rousetti]KAA8818106.1 transcription termination/antitermination protein NusA [Bifidobacterium rousetti]